MTNFQQPFGGSWTRKKLSILAGYLNAYTTALKDKPFEIVYIDAFAGTGKIPNPNSSEPQLKWRSDDPQAQEFLKGSVSIALEVANKQFDKLVFIEQDAKKCEKLTELCRKSNYSMDKIEIVNDDANAYLTKLDLDWPRLRGVLFLDPFATEVNWQTIEKVSSFKAFDTWILFPTAAISRNLPRRRFSNSSTRSSFSRLDIVYGDKSWESLYQPVEDLWSNDNAPLERQRGVEGLLAKYKGKLQAEFGSRFLNESRTLKNSTNSALFELIFCVGHPRGVSLAKKIAEHLIKKM